MPPKKKIRKWKLWKCVFCEKLLRSYNPIDKQWHICGHIGENPYFCKLCDMSFTRKHYLNNHRKTHHSASGDVRQRSFKFKCDICNKRFFHKYVRDRHQMTHSTEKPYQCDLCPAKFKVPGYLEQHRNLHQNARFSCQVCGAKLLGKMLTPHRLECHPKAKWVKRKETDPSEIARLKRKRAIQRARLEAKRDLLEMEIKLEGQRQDGERHGEFRNLCGVGVANVNVEQFQTPEPCSTQQQTDRLSIGLNNEIRVNDDDHDHDTNLNDNVDNPETMDVTMAKKKNKSGRRKKIKFKCRFCPASFRTMECLENHFMAVHKGNVDLDEDNDDENEEELCPVLLEVPIVVDEAKQETEKHPETEFKVIPVADVEVEGEVEIGNRKRTKKKEKIVKRDDPTIPPPSPWSTNLLTSFFPIECVMLTKEKKSKLTN